jgi:hypothetical protein
MPLIRNCQFGKKGRMKDAMRPQITDARFSFSQDCRDNLASPFRQRGQHSGEGFEPTGVGRLKERSTSPFLFVEAYLVSAKGAVSCQPGASPQEFELLHKQALKARFNCTGNESRFQRLRFLGRVNPGALPQAADECCAFGAADSLRRERRPFACDRVAFIWTPNK